MKKTPLPLSEGYFSLKWASELLHLSLRKTVLDFCDMCTHLSSLIETTEETKTLQNLKSRLLGHKTEARSEFYQYKSLLEPAAERYCEESLHVIFDIAENVLLPHLL